MRRCFLLEPAREGESWGDSMAKRRHLSFSLVAGSDQGRRESVWPGKALLC